MKTNETPSIEDVWVPNLKAGVSVTFVGTGAVVLP
jgi:hypothetical protein